MCIRQVLCIRREEMQKIKHFLFVLRHSIDIILLDIHLDIIVIIITSCRNMRPDKPAMQLQQFLGREYESIRQRL